LPQRGSRKILKAVFILCPQYVIAEDHMVSSYFCRKELSEKEIRPIEMASPSHIKVLEGDDVPGPIPQGHFYCSYHSWVGF
jgi:hypothetical protein